MSFISLEFFMLLSVSIMFYYLMPKRLSWLVILVTNILFYVCAGVYGLSALACGILLTYIAGIIMEKTSKYKKMLCFAYILIQLILLFLLKYQLLWNFFAPLAISFYTLTSIGCVVDVYRGKYNAEKNPLKLAAAISFFPIMVQGPICRYDEIKSQLDNRKIDFEKFTYGLTRFFYGCLKKLVIAERLSIAFTHLTKMSDDGAMIALNIIVYAFYLYTDFSSGIDMAVGIGHLFGISLPENFNSPFLAVSISDYWRRWHMSLGAWLRGYVFYPVSFSKPIVRLGRKLGRNTAVYMATLAVWFVTGIWHGVGANFIVWGMLNALVILLSYRLNPLYARFNDKYSMTKGKMYSIFRCIRTFVLMGVLRMLDYNTVSSYFKSLYIMITDFKIEGLFEGCEKVLNISNADFLVLLCGILLMFAIALWKEKHSYKEAVFNKGICFSYGIIAVMIFVTVVFGMYGIGYEGKDFIYVRY